MVSSGALVILLIYIDSYFILSASRVNIKKSSILKQSRIINACQRNSNIIFLNQLSDHKDNGGGHGSDYNYYNYYDNDDGGCDGGYDDDDDQDDVGIDINDDVILI